MIDSAGSFAPAAPVLVDGFGRTHTDLRISVTDRCNLRCTYCMPLDAVFKPREELLSYEEIARVARVAAGLAAAKTAGFRSIRINAVSIRGLTEGEIVPLALFCRREGFHLRFIEFMPLDGESSWADGQVLSGREVREILTRHVGPLAAASRTDDGQPAVDYEYADDATATGCGSRLTGSFATACSRQQSGTRGRCSARAAPTMNSPACSATPCGRSGPPMASARRRSSGRPGPCIRSGAERV